MDKAKNKAPEFSGMDYYIRRLYGKGWFPKVDSNGIVFLSGSGKIGKAALNSRRYLEDGQGKESKQGATCGTIQYGLLHDASVW